MESVRAQLFDQDMPEPYCLWTRLGNQEEIRGQQGHFKHRPTCALQLSLPEYNTLKLNAFSTNSTEHDEQYEAEAELLGETSGAIDAQREQTVARLERKIAQLENKLKEIAQ